MSYIKDSISKDEQVVYKAKLSWVFFGWPIFFVIIGIFIMFLSVVFGSCVTILGLVWAFGVFLKVRFSEFGVTNKRVIYKVGILNRTSVDLTLQQIEAIEVEQPLIGRLFNYGTIVVVGSGGTRRPFTDIDAPLVFKKFVEEQMALKFNR